MTSDFNYAPHWDDEPPPPEEQIVLAPSAIDWKELFEADFVNVDWLPGQLLTRGQQIALVADGKAGKSLFCQEWAWRMTAGKPFLGSRAHDPLRVLYLDAENGHPDLQDRFVSFGATPETLENLIYLSFPSIPPLDTTAGGAMVLYLAQEAQADIVFIDTVSRFISGAENDSDTWLGLYRNTLRLLKGEGIASVRLDHFGKDRERGSRGSSAKTQDVDHVWELTGPREGPLLLKRTHTRTGLGEDQFTIRRLGEKSQGRWVPGKTRHVLATVDERPGSPEWIAAQLDAANVPLDYGNQKARTELHKLGISVANSKIAEAVRMRKERLNLPAGNRSPNRSDDLEPPLFPDLRNANGETAGQAVPGTVAEPSGNPRKPPFRSPLPLRGGTVDGRSGPATWIQCAVCHGPMEDLGDGHTAHPTCDPSSSPNGAA